MSIHTILLQEIDKIAAKGLELSDNDLWKYYRGEEFFDDLRSFATRIVEEVKREERERIKKAFWEEFRGSGELWFTYEAMGSTEDEINEPVEEHWNSIIENCTNLQKMKEI